MGKRILKHAVESGEAFTRQTARDYTHVVIGSDRTSPSNRFEDHVISWHGSEAAAAKAMRGYTWATDLSIEAVNGGER